MHLHLVEESKREKGSCKKKELIWRRAGNGRTAKGCGAEVEEGSRLNTLISSHHM